MILRFVWGYRVNNMIDERLEELGIVCWYVEDGYTSSPSLTPILYLPSLISYWVP